jgi:hypothetical protein
MGKFVGIQNLKKYLQDVLHEQIIHNMPLILEALNKIKKVTEI